MLRSKKPSTLPKNPIVSVSAIFVIFFIRISAVLFDSDPVLLSVPTTVNVQETANDRDDMEKNNKTDENYKSLETDMNE